jgi:hypothetical protein
MIYIGYFKFVSEEAGKQGGARHGMFSSIAEAKNIEQAREIFATLILKAKKTSGLFGDTKEVYLDNVVGIKKAPKRGIMTNFQIFEGALKPSVNWELPVGTFSGINIYKWLPEDKKATAGEECHIVKPFVKF